MKLVRFGPRGSEKPGLVDSGGAIRDLSGEVADIDGGTLSPASLARLASVDPLSLPIVGSETRVGACVAGIGKILCIGLNYSDHAAESNMPVPQEPILFMKATTAINGPNDPVKIPRGSTMTDWEVELGIVIGSRARYVDESDALDYVAGYCTVNDVSERHYQLERSGQWLKGKSADTFAPVGPWMVTKDEIPDPQGLDLWLEVNGTRYQNGNTKTMIFGVETLISYVSQFMTLEPGDIIPTGTPPGVGQGQTPPMFLKAGDVVRLGVEGLGVQEQVYVASD